MPSLRRSASSPSVRLSPYPTSLSLSTTLPGASASSPSSRARTAPSQPRRASGSDLAERRVLADIAWWKVVDGQCPPSYDATHDHDDAHTLFPPTVLTLSEGPTIDSPPSPLISPYAFSLDQPIQPLSLAEDPSLMATPYSSNTRSHGRVSSFSSVESTPEVATPPLHAFDLGLDPFVAESSFELAFAPSLTRCQPPCSPLLLGCRTLSLGGFSRDGSQTHFADLGSDSFFLDEDLFT